MMTSNLDLFWQSNDDWYHWDDEVGGFVINDDAPEEAKQSYERYLEQ